MMLRASSDKKGENAELTVITDESDDDGDGGVRHGRLLMDLVDAVLDREGGDTAGARERLREVAGAEAVVDAAAVMAMFELNDRVADCTGTPLDELAIDIRLKVGEKLGMTAPS